jgi:hypothetical protein
MKLSLPPILVENLVWVPVIYSFCKISFPVRHLMAYYAEMGVLAPLNQMAYYAEMAVLAPLIARLYG